jgi:hypothetical protein
LGAAARLASAIQNFPTGYAPDSEFDIAIQFRFAPSESVVDFQLAIVFVCGRDG